MSSIPPGLALDDLEYLMQATKILSIDCVRDFKFGDNTETPNKLILYNTDEEPHELQVVFLENWLELPDAGLLTVVVESLCLVEAKGMLVAVCKGDYDNIEMFTNSFYESGLASQLRMSIITEDVLSKFDQSTTTVVIRKLR